MFESEKDYEKVKDKIEIRSIDSFFVKEYINANNQEFFAYVKKANNDKDFVTSYDKERKERIENILLAKKEELKKLKETNPSEYEKKVADAKERTRKLNIPTLNSFSEFMQNKIAEGKNVEFVIKEIPMFTVVMSRIVSLLPTIMFMILIYLTLKMYGTGKSRTSIWWWSKTYKC